MSVLLRPCSEQRQAEAGLTVFGKLRVLTVYRSFLAGAEQTFAMKGFEQRLDVLRIERAILFFEVIHTPSRNRFPHGPRFIARQIPAANGYCLAHSGSH